MTHPLLDESSVPMAVHSAEVRRGRKTVHRDRPDEDPAGAPSGLRWRLLEHGGWRLWQGEVCVGAILYGTDPIAVKNIPGGGWEHIAIGPLDWVAAELVRQYPGTPLAPTDLDAP